MYLNALNTIGANLPRKVNSLEMDSCFRGNDDVAGADLAAVAWVTEKMRKLKVK